MPSFEITVTDRPIWCFDVEARPGPWGGGDFTFRHMLSIAAGSDPNPRHIDYLGPWYINDPVLLEHFIAPIRDPDTLVVTHNGPRYDLPFLNGTLMRLGLEPLGEVLVSDTYAHLPKRGQAFSASLGNLADRFGITAKGHMSEADWDRVYHGDKGAHERLREYNVGDVVTTLSLRAKLLELGVLGPPKVWKP